MAFGAEGGALVSEVGGDTQTPSAVFRAGTFGAGTFGVGGADAVPGTVTAGCAADQPASVDFSFTDGFPSAWKKTKSEQSSRLWMNFEALA